MLKVTSDHNLNSMVVVAKGKATFEELSTFLKTLTMKLALMKPGFFLIHDLSEFTPPNTGATRLLKSLQGYFIRRKIKKVFRVRGEGIMYSLLLRIARQSAIPYEVEEVDGIQQANQKIWEFYLTGL